MMAFSDEVRARLDADAGQIIARYPRSRSAMLPLLHLLQAEEGHISDDGIAWCADQLGLAESEVASVVSFYTMFKRHPVGEYHVGVCTNTLCAILGGDEILASLREHLGVGDDEATPDGKVSLEHVECNAACDFAPVVMVNWEFFDNMTPATARALVDDLRSGAGDVRGRTDRRRDRGGGQHRSGDGRRGQVSRSFFSPLAVAHRSASTLCCPQRMGGVDR